MLNSVHEPSRDLTRFELDYCRPRSVNGDPASCRLLRRCPGPCRVSLLQPLRRCPQAHRHPRAGRKRNLVPAVARTVSIQLAFATGSPTCCHFTGAQHSTSASRSTSCPRYRSLMASLPRAGGSGTSIPTQFPNVIVWGRRPTLTYPTHIMQPQQPHPSAQNSTPMHWGKAKSGLRKRTTWTHCRPT